MRTQSVFAVLVSCAWLAGCAQIPATREPVNLSTAEAAVAPPLVPADPAARATWDAFPRSVKRGLLELVLQAKKPETRARRIATIVTDAAVGSRGPFDRTRRTP